MKNIFCIPYKNRIYSPIFKQQKSNQGYLLVEVLIVVFIFSLIFLVYLVPQNYERYLHKQILTQETEKLAYEVLLLQEQIMHGVMGKNEVWPSLYIGEKQYYWFGNKQRVRDPINFVPSVTNKKGFSNVSFALTGLPTGATTIVLQDQTYQMTGRIYIAVQTGRIRWEIKDD